MTDLKSTTYLNFINYKVGDQVSIEELGHNNVSRELVTILRNSGLEKFCVSKETIWQMLEALIQEQLERYSIDPVSIDGVLMATESFSGVEESESGNYFSFRHKFYEMLRKCGLINAYPLSMSFSGCANLLSGLALANEMVQTGRMSKVLILAGDRISSAYSRVIPPAIGVLSDGVSMCIVSKENTSGLAIGEYSFGANLNITDDMDMGKYIVSLRSCIKELSEKFQKISQKRIDAYQRVFINNYSLTTVHPNS